MFMNFKSPLKAVLILIMLFLAACAGKKEVAHEREDESVWKELDDFHTIMAETFHPYKDSSDLEPVKIRALELMTAADRFASATLPGKVDKEEVKSKLQQLKSEATSLAESVKDADDNEIAGHLTKLHDTFHEIQEAWYGE